MMTMWLHGGKEVWYCYLYFATLFPWCHQTWKGEKKVGDESLNLKATSTYKFFIAFYYGNKHGFLMWIRFGNLVSSTTSYFHIYFLSSVHSILAGVIKNKCWQITYQSRNQKKLYRVIRKNWEVHIP